MEFLLLLASPLAGALESRLAEPLEVLDLGG
jgi:hypothetical protein